MPVCRTFICREQMMSAHGRLERVLHTGTRLLSSSRNFNNSCNMRFSTQMRIIFRHEPLIHVMEGIISSPKIRVPIAFSRPICLN